MKFDHHDSYFNNPADQPNSAQIHSSEKTHNLGSIGKKRGTNSKLQMTLSTQQL